MLMSIANIVAIVVMGILVWRLGRERRVGNSPAARWLRIAALIPLGLPVSIYLLFGIGETGSGEPGGAMHLVTLIPLVLLAVLAWMRPLEGGIAFFACGVVAAIGYLAAVAPSGPLPPGTLMNSMLTITAYPQILSGVLFFLAGWLSRRARAPVAEQGKTTS